MYSRTSLKYACARKSFWHFALKVFDGEDGMQAWLGIKIAFALGMTSICSSVHANKINGDTPLLILGSKPTPAQEIQAKGGDIATTEIVYEQLAIANEDIFGSDAKVIGKIGSLKLASKGDQFFGVTGSNGQISYCLVENKQVGAFDGFFVTNRDKHTCFIDKDRNGKFESSYDLRTKLTSVPLYFYVETDGNPLVREVGYTSVQPDKLRKPMLMKVKAARISAKDNKWVLKSYLQLDSAVDTFRDRIEINLSSKATIVEVFGAKIAITLAGNGNARAEVLQGFVRSQFLTAKPRISYNIIII
jgi:hypothetical protein